MGRHLNYSGFVIAGVGFFLTRFTVTLAIYEEPMRFYLAGVVPLALGLGLAAVGVVLAVAEVDAAVVRTTAAWCVVGTATMTLLALLTVLGTAGELTLDPTTVRSESHLSTFLIGGSIGGTLTGLYAARNRRQRRELRRQADRLGVLNHMLRHKILNALTPIRGFAAVNPEETPRAAEIVERRADDIEATVEEVRYFTNRTGPDATGGVATDLQASLSEAIAAVEAEHPDVEVAMAGDPTGLDVRADDRLSLVFTHLLENAVEHGGDENPRVVVKSSEDRVQVSIEDDGPGLPDDQRRLLETGAVEEADRLDLGFGLDLVRLFAESYGTKVETDVEGGTTVTVTFPRVSAADGRGSTATRLTDVRSGSARLGITLVASLLAGVAYGVTSEALGGSIAGIGVFYGTPSALVGWITHEFHSVVFGFAFLSLLAMVPERYRQDPLASVGVGLGWGLVLWLVAAGIVAPIWLQLLGVPASLPNLTLPLLVSHAVWGIVLGALTACGHRYVVPWLDDLGAGEQARSG